MERLAQITAAELVTQMRAQFEATLAQVAAAVNAAPEGKLIDASEEACREALGKFREVVYEAALQLRISATEQAEAFSPGGTADQPRPGPAERAVRLRARALAAATLRRPGGGQRDAGGRSD